MRSVCVFLASSSGHDASYTEAVRALGQEIARRGMRLVYGGASVGLMRTLADAALAGGGEVVGVIPETLVEREVAHPGLTTLHVVANMHQRKALMAELADGFVVAPGGFGTLEEAFEVLTGRQLSLHDKPVVLLDVRQFWAPLIAFLDRAVDEGLLRAAVRDHVLVADSAAAAMALLHP
ncbi:MAG: TIGR00730 family Rossman fold protein [Kofleriaceae bacterium]